MDLKYTAEQEAFRKEARAWLEANVPKEKLASFDTKEGFEQHREWEKKLQAVVTQWCPGPSSTAAAGRTSSNG